MVYNFSNTQIQIPSDLSKIFLHRGRQLVRSADLYKEHQGYEDNPHITVLFGIHDEEPPLELVDALETYPKFTVTMGLVSLFKSQETGKNFDVVKADIHSPDLHVLNGIVRQTCKYSTEFPEYKPHATVAYVRPDRCDYLDGNPAFKGLSFVADRLLFSSVKGTKREILFARR